MRELSWLPITLAVLFLPIAPLVLLDKTCGDNGPACHQHVCKCGGDFEKRLPEDQMNPRNKKHPTYVCNHGCGEKSCCACLPPKGHDASAHVTKAGGKPSFCAACKLSKKGKP